ncbi:hypothetical protein ACQV2B_05405 [Pantoea allii]|uniref:hypothetical protein n=1 Tax=Pantoea allii TaxID=574096 RepID=UPI003D3213AC
MRNWTVIKNILLTDGYIEYWGQVISIGKPPEINKKRHKGRYRFLQHTFFFGLRSVPTTIVVWFILAFSMGINSPVPASRPILQGIALLQAWSKYNTYPKENPKWQIGPSQ